MARIRADDAGQDAARAVALWHGASREDVLAAGEMLRAWAARNLAASPLPNDIRRERRLGAEPPVEGRDDAVLTVPQRTSSS